MTNKAEAGICRICFVTSSCKTIYQPGGFFDLIGGCDSGWDHCGYGISTPLPCYCITTPIPHPVFVPIYDGNGTGSTMFLAFGMCMCN